jgi:hypothetical protein
VGVGALENRHGTQRLIPIASQRLMASRDSRSGTSFVCNALIEGPENGAMGSIERKGGPSVFDEI